MITPEFDLSQDDEFVTILLKMPFIKSRHIELRVDGVDFQVYARPYHLKLEFSGMLVEDEKMRTKYDLSKGEMVVTITKVVKGEHFENLDLLPQLLFVEKERAPQFKRNIIEEPSYGLLEDDIPDKDIDFKIRETEAFKDTNQQKYGFNNQYDLSKGLVSEITDDIINRKSLNALPGESRRKIRFTEEDLKFDEEHYITDFLDCDLMKPILQFRPQTYQLLTELQAERKKTGAQSNYKVTSKLRLKEHEEKILLELPKRSYIIVDHRVILLGLLDLLLAYSYDHRTTLGDRTLESPWTIAKLSSLLSNFESFYSLIDALKAFIRRSLAFPLYRNYQVSSKCIKDALIVLKLGKDAVLRALLSIRDCLESDLRTSLLSSIYLDDYCIWIQKCPEIYIQKLASELNNIKVEKGICEWDLDSLESKAAIMMTNASE